MFTISLQDFTQAEISLNKLQQFSNYGNAQNKGSDSANLGGWDSRYGSVGLNNNNHTVQVRRHLKTEADVSTANTYVKNQSTGARKSSSLLLGDYDEYQVVIKKNYPQAKSCNQDRQTNSFSPSNQDFRLEHFHRKRYKDLKYGIFDKGIGVQDTSNLRDQQQTSQVSRAKRCSDHKSAIRQAIVHISRQSLTVDSAFPNHKNRRQHNPPIIELSYTNSMRPQPCEQLLAAKKKMSLKVRKEKKTKLLDMQNNSLQNQQHNFVHSTQLGFLSKASQGRLQPHLRPHDLHLEDGYSKTKTEGSGGTQILLSNYARLPGKKKSSNQPGRYVDRPIQSPQPESLQLPPISKSNENKMDIALLRRISEKRTKNNKSVSVRT